MGTSQARLLGERLRVEGFAGQVFSSPFIRCLDTAEQICDALGATFRPVGALGGKSTKKVEKLRSMKGITASEAIARYARCAREASLPYPWWATEPESMDDVTNRVGAWLEQVITSSDRDILVVSHKVTANRGIQYLTERSINDLLHCSLTSVRVSPQREVLIANDVAHLQTSYVTGSGDSYEES